MNATPGRRNATAGRARWEHFEHDADIGVRGLGPTREKAFEMAALGLTAVVVDPQQVQCTAGWSISCEAPDDVTLLIDWLNALIFELSARRRLAGRFAVAITQGRLAAEASGECIDPERHHPAVEPKGATFTEAHVGQRPDGTWVAQCVVDV